MKLKGILGALAPTLVKTVASSNPIAGMAVKLAAKKLGMPETSSIEQIEEVVEREPEKAEILQDAELEIKKLTANIEGFRLDCSRLSWRSGQRYCQFLLRKQSQWKLKVWKNS